MAEKTLTTRIISKHADLAAWGTSTLVLKAGEIALASINTTRPDGQGGSITVPTYLMKVGDGEKTFKDLNWLAAPASDVYAWAKKQNLALADIPTMDADHIPTLEVSKINGLATRLENLETALGDSGSVAGAIKTAIEALDVDASTDADGVVIASISETDGKIAVTRRALKVEDIPALAIAKITGLQDKLDALVAKDTSLEGSITTEVSDRKAADTEINKSINELKTAIGNMSNIMNFRGAVESKDAITDPVEGDVIAVTAGDDAGKEFVYSDGAWVEFGSVTAQDTAIKALQDRATALETKMTSAEAAITKINGTGDGSIAKALADAKAYADTKKDEAITAVQGTDEDTAASSTVMGAKKFAENAVSTLSSGQVTTNKDAIASLNTKVKAIEADYLKAADTYIFDCGGAE